MIVLAPSCFRQIVEVSIGLVDLVEGLLETDEEVVSLVGSFRIVSKDDDLVRGEEVFELVSHIFCVCDVRKIFWILIDFSEKSGKILDLEEFKSLLLL